MSLYRKLGRESGKSACAKGGVAPFDEQDKPILSVFAYFERNMLNPTASWTLKPGLIELYQRRLIIRRCFITQQVKHGSSDIAQAGAGDIIA